MVDTSDGNEIFTDLAPWDSTRYVMRGGVCVIRKAGGMQILYAVAVRVETNDVHHSLAHEASYVLQGIHVDEAGQVRDNVRNAFESLVQSVEVGATACRHCHNQLLVEAHHESQAPFLGHAQQHHGPVLVKRVKIRHTE